MYSIEEMPAHGEMIVACYVDDIVAAVSNEGCWKKFIEEFTYVEEGGFIARDEGEPDSVLGEDVSYEDDG